MFQTLQEVQHYSANFAAEREWQRFQSPKNLAMALSVEASELLEIFQWITEAESRQLSDVQQQAVADELADVLLYLVRLADETGIDLLKAATHKVVKNEEKYPAEKVKGSAAKYTTFTD